MSISKNQLKLITSLSQKKYRQQHKLFIAEGVKVINELRNSLFKIHHVFATDDFDISISDDKITRISQADLQKISNLKTANKVLGLFEIPADKEIDYAVFTLALDDINDPGNLGTIIRLCDWFGVSQLICSKKTVDCYNQKVVQASMGSLTRVKIIYHDLKEFIQTSNLPTFIADMNGKNVYQSKLPKQAILIMGNEANGISENINTLVKNIVSIPQFGENQQTESLNVATATAILLSEFKRNIIV